MINSVSILDENFCGLFSLELLAFVFLVAFGFFGLSYAMITSFIHFGVGVLFFLFFIRLPFFHNLDACLVCFLC